MMIPSRWAGISVGSMDLVPRRNRIAFLLMPDGLAVQRRFHGRGPSSSVTWLLTVIDFSDEIGKEKEELFFWNG